MTLRVDMTPADLAHTQPLPAKPTGGEVSTMPAHPYDAPSTPASLARLTQLANLADALTQRGHEARLIVSAPFVAVRTPQGPGPFKRIYLCDGRFHWTDTEVSGPDIASHDDIPRAADTIARALSDSDTRLDPHQPATRSH
jgi:hypothetical protein